MPPADPRSRRLPSQAYTLTIRQQPERARVVGAKEKDRKPIDPPPVVQLHIEDRDDATQNWLQSPYYFMIVNLWDKHEDKEVGAGALVGSLTSSLHKLKDVNNNDGAFFVFGDISVRHEGVFRLHFSLFEMLQGEAQCIQSIFSDPFTVYSGKNFPGMKESTFLSRSFSDQGVRLRVRKETRSILRRHAPSPPSSARSQEYPQYASHAGQETSSIGQRPEEYQPHSLHSHQEQSNFVQPLHSNVNPLYQPPSGTPSDTYPRDFEMDYTSRSMKRRRTSGVYPGDSYDPEPGHYPRTFQHPQTLQSQASSIYAPTDTQVTSYDHDSPITHIQSGVSAYNLNPRGGPSLQQAPIHMASQSNLNPAYGVSVPNSDYDPYARYPPHGSAQPFYGMNSSVSRMPQPPPLGSREANDQLQTNDPDQYTGMSASALPRNEHQPYQMRENYQSALPMQSLNQGMQPPSQRYMGSGSRAPYMSSVTNSGPPPLLSSSHPYPDPAKPETRATSQLPGQTEYDSLTHRMRSKNYPASDYMYTTN